MKNNRLYPICMSMLLPGFLLLLVSCNYDDIRDADYPDQIVYMPAANQTVYDVTDVPELDPNHPSNGAPYRFQIHEESDEFIIPLGVYRAGVTKNGSFSVMITTDTDMVVSLLNQGIFDSHSGGSEVDILPQNSYSLPATVHVTDGEDHETFNLVVDLSFLRSHSSISHALGVSIASNERTVNPDLSSTVVYIPAGIAD